MIVTSLVGEFVAKQTEIFRGFLWTEWKNFDSSIEASIGMSYQLNL